MKKCPYCAEKIKDEAIVCPYCERKLSESLPEFSTKQSTLSSTKKSTIRQMVILLSLGVVGIIIAISIFSPRPSKYGSVYRTTIYPTNTDKPPSTQTSTPTISTISLTGYVGNQSLRIRKGPGTQFDILGGMPAKTCVSVTGRNQDSSWVWISDNTNTGWVSSEYLLVEGNIAQLPVIGDDGILIGADSSRSTTGFLVTHTAEVKLTAVPPSVTPSKTRTPLAAPKREIILCKDTGTLVGSILSCKIQYAYCSYEPRVDGSPTFCNDAPYPNHHFTLLIWGQDWSDLNGKCIIVTGRVNFYSGKLQIEASNRSQVSLCK